MKIVEFYRCPKCGNIEEAVVGRNVVFCSKCSKQNRKWICDKITLKPKSD